MSNESNVVLEARHISKSFGLTVALEDVTLRFEDEKIYGLFGRNGAGKTTLLNILADRTSADSGLIRCSGEISGKHAGTIAENCCYVPERHYLPGRFKVSHLLRLASASFPDFDMDEARRLIGLFKLDTEQKYEQLSRGHQSILRIVLGLSSCAPITIFDEPVLGLDAVARDRFYSELIESFSRNPRLFIISTHFIAESADLFNEAIIIRNGKVIKQASVDQLLSNAFYVSGKSALVDTFVKGSRVLDSQVAGNVKTALVEGHLDGQSPVTGLRFSPVTMQKLFIHMTGDGQDQEQTS